MFEASAAQAEDCAPEVPGRSAPRWGASSETGRLTDVMLCTPPYLRMVPCNAMTMESLANGLSTSTPLVLRQHRAFAAALEKAGVRCHFAPPDEAMPDLCFMRDAALMTPWGLIELRPALSHRRDETAHIAAAARALGVPVYGRVDHGTVEGGDVCLIRDGLVAIGCSGDRTSDEGARALAALFERRGWEVIVVEYDARFLHLDTILTLVAPDCAVACIAQLPKHFLDRLDRLGVALVPASADEAASLGVNLLSLGDDRVVAVAGARLNRLLADRGIEVIEVEIDQFTRCGGGPHCLTMPLARQH